MVRAASWSAGRRACGPWCRCRCAARGTPSSATGGSLGNRVASFLVDLPGGRAEPLVRLHQVTPPDARAHRHRRRRRRRHSSGSAGSPCRPLHAVGGPGCQRGMSRYFNLVVTNVLARSSLLYAAGARMLRCSRRCR
ncbi:hypothetical protein HBB16_07325 [Pseudonocardia sp. MCCB 268]|nr:hypothetical protein [Pseudonocardia cytotoxica]